MIFNKKVVIFFLLIFISSKIFAQKVIVHAFIQNKIAPPKSDTIYYDFNRKLSWSDFQGTPDNNNPAGAITASGFAFDSQMNFDGKTINLIIGVFTFFIKSDSWKKPQINSAYHLEHEQHHFDITRLTAQRFLYEVSRANFTKENYSNLLTSIFDKCYKENNQLQEQYDNETRHSLDVQQQLSWNKKIDDEIQKLKEDSASPL